MTNQKLKETLEKLHLELLQLDPENEEIANSRDALVSEINSALENENLTEHEVTLTEALEEAVISFEDAHPKITQLINVVTNILGSIGI